MIGRLAVAAVAALLSTGTHAQTTVTITATDPVSGSVFNEQLPANFNPTCSPPCAVAPVVTTQTIFGSAVPVKADDADTNSVEIGLKFQASVAGRVVGVRFYKGSLNTGVHVGNLWSSAGTLLAQATFTNETASGWQQVNFASPVSIAAGTTYVISYFAPHGQYAADANGLASAITNSNLTALASGGVFAYGTTSTFPIGTFQSTNYWVDVLFASP